MTEKIGSLVGIILLVAFVTFANILSFSTFSDSPRDVDNNGIVFTIFLLINVFVTFPLAMLISDYFFQKDQDEEVNKIRRIRVYSLVGILSSLLICIFGIMFNNKRETRKYMVAYSVLLLGTVLGYGGLFVYSQVKSKSLGQ